METLPCDIWTEDSVLGSVIFHKGEYEKALKYFSNDEVFYQKRARLLWKKIVKMERSKEPVNCLTICSSLTKEDTKEGLTAYYVPECTSNAGALGATAVHANKLYVKYWQKSDIKTPE